jgi:hypothetical protein
VCVWGGGGRPGYLVCCDAGNVGSVQSTEFWIDAAPPSSILLSQAPRAINSDPVAVFSVQAPQGKTSPGQLRYGALSDGRLAYRAHESGCWMIHVDLGPCIPWQSTNCPRPQGRLWRQ